MKTCVTALMAALVIVPLSWALAADTPAPTTQPAADPAKIAEALAAIDAAKKAVDSGDKAAALAELDKAKGLLTAMAEKPAQKLANKKCPIMGNPVVAGKVPAVLTREWKGQTIGFCCGGCPASWDKLTDQEKEAKLKAANE